MRFDLTHLRGGREHVDRTFESSAFDPPDPDYRVVAPVHLSMDVEKSGVETYLATGRVSTRLELECSRCVEPFDLAVDSEFELRFVPESAEARPAVEEDREIAQDDLTTAFYAGGAVDLIQLQREQFQLALPMKPLCRDACRGLCVVCGANLNDATCACRPQWEDPRLAALKGLLDRQKEN